MGKLISLPHLAQTADGYCLPACARMILASLGMEHTEAEIASVLGTLDYGTPSFAVTRLESLGVAVNYREWTVQELLTELDAGHPVILFVRTGFLDHWTIDVAHAAIVVSAFMNGRFWIHDPALVSGPTSVSWDGVLAAWAEFGYLGATITRRPKT